MKIKLFIPILSALLFAICLIIDLRSGQNSALDKWMSFGMGLTAPVFVSSLISVGRSFRKLNPKS